MIKANFEPAPGHALVSIEKELIRNIYGVNMPIEESSEDNQVCGIIIAITNGKKSEDIIDFYKVGDKVFFKKWAGVKIHPSQISEKPAAHQLVVVPINDLVGRVVNDNHSDKQNKELDNA